MFDDERCDKTTHHRLECDKERYDKTFSVTRMMYQMNENVYR